MALKEEEKKKASSLSGEQNHRHQGKTSPKKGQEHEEAKQRGSKMKNTVIPFCTAEVQSDESMHSKFMMH